MATRLSAQLGLFGVAIAIGAGASAQTITPTHTIRAQTIIAADDIQVLDREIPGTHTSIENVIGQEARVALYAGRPIRLGEIGPPALVERNQIVTLIYSVNGLTIATEARALARGGLGDMIRVINLSSRASVSGWVLPDGLVSVSPPQFPHNKD